MDESNPVIAAVGRGMAAEHSGDLEAARAAYDEAWNAATDDYERCVAAHYVPRLIEDPAEKLKWNRDALRFADAVGDERVQGFYASLHAMVGYCLRLLGDRAGATAAYETAKTHLGDVEAGPYKEKVAAGIDMALAGLAAGGAPDAN